MCLGFLYDLGDGEVLSWGENQNGALGIGNRDASPNPTFIKSISEKIIQIQAGQDFSMLLSGMFFLLLYLRTMKYI